MGAAPGGRAWPGAGAEAGAPDNNAAWQAPQIALPKGGGAIRGIGEKFAANPVAGTGGLTVPIAASPGRSGFGPQLSLTYDSGAGNGAFGFGWSLALPSISRKTDKGLPQYRDADESDVFVLAGAEDLVPVLLPDGRRFEDATSAAGFLIHRYMPRTEGAFARLERWTQPATGEVHWRAISRDNVTTRYGTTPESRIADPDNPRHVFAWLLCESYDAQGNAIVYAYAGENDEQVAASQDNERNRTRPANRYLKRIRYGNQVSRLLQPDLAAAHWLFELVFDYEEGHFETLPPQPAVPAAAQHPLVRAAALPELPWNAARRAWPQRPDPFSSYRPGFEVRTCRRCHRVLQFHRFAELGSEPYLVRSTEFGYADLDYQQPHSIDDELAHAGSTRFASFICSITQSGYVRDDSQPVLTRAGVNFPTYRRKSWPALEVAYSKASIQPEVRELDAASLENLPIGLDGAAYLWVDLDSEGAAGILTEQARAWFYKPNQGEGHFGPLQRLGVQPSLADLRAGRQQLLDLAGDGHLDLVALAGPTPGFYKRTQNADWEPYRAFRDLPNVAWDNPNLRFVDLNGDGHADVLITEHEAITWHLGRAEAGFGPAQRVPQPPDEERGPRLAFADGTQSVYLADMSGDGLTDLVRVRNGEICYWPNLGYGRFGAKVTMDNAPWFDAPEEFSQQRVRLADIDGSGTTDVLYLGRAGVRLYFNQSGNRWSAPRPLPPFPFTDNLATVLALDLLGNGTACLVWSSPLPGAAGHPLRYIDLMGGQKPHLLVRATNNLGAETEVQYVASSKFYLADKLAGKPWVTRLPFPVHVVERVATHDRISANRFVTRYAYHHGYFDGVEREFRGFGLVEQWDTEEFAALGARPVFPVGTNVDAASHVPPVHTKTWFHTGAYFNREALADFFAGLVDERDLGEYYRPPGTTDAQARQQLLAAPLLPPGLTADEEREACRALKGAMLRQEVYALDGTARQAHPYAVTEQRFAVQALQRRGPNRHAVFLAHAHESLSYHYERNPDDPRVAHTLTLAVDAFGNVLRSAAVGYPRAAGPERQPEQNQTHITLTLSRVANQDDHPDWRRIGIPIETRTYEVVKPPAAARRFAWEELSGLVAALVPPDQAAPAEAFTIPSAQWDWRTRWNPETEPGGPATTHLRLLAHARTRYRPDDLGAAAGSALALLPLGAVESRALPGQHHQLAFTPDLLADIYGDKLSSAQLETDGRYEHSEGDANWWIPSGRVFYSPGSADAPAQELAQARQHFFRPQRYRGPFHSDAVATESFVTYDAYDLLPVATSDALGNVVTVVTQDDAGLAAPRIDYRVLQPYWTTDPNGNRARTAFDALGLVVGTARMGKPQPAPAEGDSLDGFVADLTEAETIAQLTSPLADPTAVLAQASTRLIYDLFAYQRTKGQALPQPAVVGQLARETHASDPAGASSKIQRTFSYSDGFGREIQKKVPAEAGPVPKRGADQRIIVGADGQPEMTATAVSPRWVGSGWTVFNNKGQPVRQYEPFFSDSPGFEFDVRVGVSPVLFYDPVGRLVATLHPNHTWEKVVFGPWRQQTWDASDTGLIADPKTDADVGPFFQRLPDAEYLPTWAAQRQGGALGAAEQAAARQAAIHAATPATAHADALGRPFLTVAHNKFLYSDAAAGTLPTEEFYRTRVVFDLEGNPREIIDANNRAVVRYDYDVLGRRIHQHSMEAGRRWLLPDVAGQPLHSWDSRDHRFRVRYDALRRPTESFVREGAGPEQLVGRSVYGETRPSPEAGNLRGQVVQHFDQAGVATSEAYDFKGNLLRSQRQLAQAYKTTLDWAGTVPLDAPVYASRSAYDALNRPTALTAPDQSTVRPGYNEAGLPERVAVNLRGAQQNGQPVWTPFVTNIDYDAKGQRTLIDYGNGVRTTYEYDALTFRLIHLLSRRAAADFPDDCPQPPPAGWPGCQVQNLRYTYDPVGNITHLADDAQQTRYFQNRRVEPSADYTYDAVYRLLEATGREHLGQVGAAPAPSSYNDKPRLGILFSASDGNAVGRYLERYAYDAVGNFQQVTHRGTDPSNPGWTRTYAYREASQLEPALPSNRLTSTSIGALTETYSTGGNGYDAHGNLLGLPQLQLMQWNFHDQLQMTQRQAVSATDDEGQPRQGERTYYVYDARGQRVRKVTELATGQIKDERIYLGGFEVYRRAGLSPLVRETLHVMDDRQRVALVETRTQGNEPAAPAQLIRYQLTNHLGSASLELDARAQLISYEEYTPYGSTSFQAVRGQTDAPKRYRYTGKERDEESGFYYHGARYYAPWLGRWTSCDPSGVADGTNLFAYVQLNPARLRDLTGLEGTSGDQQSSWQRFKNQAQAAISVAQIIIYGGAPRDPKLDFSRVLEVGPARQAFLANTFGAPFEEPKDPADRAEWKRGEDTAAVVAAAELVAGAIGPPAPPTTPQFAPATGRVAGTAAARPAVVTRPPGLFAANNAEDTNKPATPAKAEEHGPDNSQNSSSPKPPKEKLYTPFPPSEPNQSTVPKGTKTPDAQIKAEKEEYLESGKQVRVITEPTERHHIASDKSSKYTPLFEKLFRAAGMSLQDEANLVSIEGHGGAHGADYHEVVLKRLTQATEGKAPNTPEFKKAFTEALGKIKTDVARPGSHLNSLVTR